MSNAGVQNDYQWAGRTLEPPEGGLHPATKIILMGLPTKARLDILGVRFPRIANRIAQDWTQPDVLKLYLRDLLTTDRPGREGFPAEVLRELFSFANFYNNEVFPDPKSVWDFGA